MRFRRLELAIIALTLAFVCFLGGFFTGRSFNAVSVEEFGSIHVESVSIPGDTGDSGTTNVVEPQVATATDRDELSADANADEEREPTQQSEAAPGAPRGGDGRININTASKNELMDLSGIGPALADRIIEYRTANGGFTTIEDIMKVSGIAEGRFSRIKDQITV